MIEEKKLQNLFTGRPHNNTFTAYIYDFSQQSYHLLQVKAIKINWELSDHDCLINRGDLSIEVKFTVIKGRIFGDIFNWSLNRG